MKFVEGLFIVMIVLYIASFILHLLGLLVLKHLKWQTQNMLLANLSVSEAISLLLNIINMSITLYNRFSLGNEIAVSDLKSPKPIMFLSYCVVINIIFLMITMTIERVICVVSPFKYYIRLQEKSMFLKLMVAMSLFSIGFGFVLFYLNTQYGFIVLNIATVVFFHCRVCTYRQKDKTVTSCSTKSIRYFSGRCQLPFEYQWSEWI